MSKKIIFFDLIPNFLLVIAIAIFATTSVSLAFSPSKNFLVSADYGTTVETIASFTDLVPRSIAVSPDSRVFICCPRVHNTDANTLVEIRNGTAFPYPDSETNKIDLHNLNRCILNAMAAVVDNNNALWVLDSGKENRMLVYGGAKLVGFDLKTNKPFKTILLKNFVLSPDVVLYDLEIDPTHGKSGTALISASGSVAPGTMIVSDLETGHTMRRLHLHSSLHPDENYSGFVEGEMVRVHKANGSQSWFPGAFGLTINAEHDRLYYSAVASQDIFSVDLNKLCDPNVSEEAVESTIRRIDYKVAIGTGIECDRQNRIYLSDVEHNSIWRRRSDGTNDIVAHSDKLCYPDHLYLANDGYLYVTNSQYRHGAQQHFGEDERLPPFEVLRIFVNTTSDTLCSHPF